MISDALKLIRRNNPARPEDFRALGLRLEGLGAGAFRTVYQIEDLPLAVKFPIPNTDLRLNKIHTRTEIARIKKFQRFKWMRKYLPKVYYYDSKTGVAVFELVDDSKYKFQSSEHMRMYGMCRLAEDLISRLTGVKLDDLGPDNVRYKKNRNIKLIDLAY